MYSYRPYNIEHFKQQALQWAASFDIACYLDSNNFQDKYSKYDTLIAVGVKAEISAHTGNAFIKLAEFKSAHPGWIFGFFGYDLKNELEQVSSNNPDGLQFPDLYFFAPQHLILVKGKEVEVISNNAEDILLQIAAQQLQHHTETPRLNLQSKFSKDDYIAAANKIKEHIVRGDIYVTNFCQEFFADDAVIDPLNVFKQLNEISPNPLAAFFKLYDKYILSASPERFLAKRDNRLISQPIKGTARRGKTDTEDEQIKEQLRNHTKELQENVMVVDLVRNDLTRSAKPGTVVTEELFGIYSFTQVHQMISTVTCELNEELSAVDAIKYSFPMGSMTGAPKVNAMKLMERYERSKRGVYSGAVGYFSADGDFDFNVVIRTLLYNAGNRYLSFQTGSAITFSADAEAEYEECLLKAKAILQTLGQKLS